MDTGGWLFPPKPGSRVAVSFRGHDVRKAPFQGHFLRYEGEGEVPSGPFPHWRRNPEGWFELWPREPLLASSMEEAKAKFAPLFPYVEDGSIDDQFEKRPYQTPVMPQLVEEIEHPTHVARTQIVQYPDGLYAVGYLVYAPNGRYLRATSPTISNGFGWEWGVMYVQDEEGQCLRTLADDLASAQEIATIELHQLVAQDSEIKRR